MTASIDPGRPGAGPLITARMHLNIRWVKISSQIYNAVAASLSGVMLFLAFPKYDIWWLAWIGLLPLLFVIQRESAKIAFLWSYVCGIVFYAGIFNWVLEVPGYKFYHHLISIPYLGLYFAVFGWIFSRLKNQWNPLAALFSAPFIWVAFEFLRANISFMALPWAMLAHSQYQIPSIIQIAVFSGAYGVSFLIVAVNSALAAVVFPFRPLTNEPESPYFQLLSKRVRILMLCMTAMVLTLTLGFGFRRISNQSPGRHIKVAVVQGNINREQKRDLKKNAGFIMRRHEGLTQEAATDHPNRIVWPEAATPG